MSRYIDAERLKAEIERRKDFHRETYAECKDERFINDECEDDRILSLITSLQQEQPEVDLEKEIDEYYHANLGLILSTVDTKVIVSEIARHFAEWGAIHLNARKEK